VIQKTAQNLTHRNFAAARVTRVTVMRLSPNMSEIITRITTEFQYRN